MEGLALFLNNVTLGRACSYYKAALLQLSLMFRRNKMLA